MATPQGGWLRGIVKEVPSGDTVVVMAATKSGIAPEKRLILSSLTAPKLVSVECEDLFVGIITASDLTIEHAL